ncbi:MAG: hypothetical protein NTY19_19005 [Planctomycetota bacterium]|nr:hypothetical protein [Planctomycetota bacterium]
MDHIEEALQRFITPHPLADPQVVDAFLRHGLNKERQWFARNLRARHYRRELTPAELSQLHLPPGSHLAGHRLSTGDIVWLVYYPQATTGENGSPKFAAGTVVAMKGVNDVTKPAPTSPERVRPESSLGGALDPGKAGQS